MKLETPPKWKQSSLTLMGELDIDIKSCTFESSIIPYVWEINTSISKPQPNKPFAFIKPIFSELIQPAGPIFITWPWMTQSLPDLKPKLTERKPKRRLKCLKICFSLQDKCWTKH